MPHPRIFVSSTYYDLKHVREIIRKFIIDFGYEPILSEFSDVFYKPSDTVQNSCLKEIATCDMFVLIIGKRYGSEFPGDFLSITHKEYLEAQSVKIPIYSFIDIDVLHDYEFYSKNDRASRYQYRVVENDKVFSLIEEVKKATKDNSLISYSSIDDILQHLKKQWAFLLKSFLAEQKEDNVKKTEPLKDFNAFLDKLTSLGLSNITEQELTSAENFYEILAKKNPGIIDNSTDLRINVDGKIINVGKQVIEILNNEFWRIKGE